MEHQRPYRSAIGLLDIILWAIEFSILTSVLIAMNYLFRYQKSTFNLENNKCICQGILF